MLCSVLYFKWTKTVINNKNQQSKTKRIKDKIEYMLNCTEVIF